MKWRVAGLVAAAWLAGGCGNGGSSKYSGSASGPVTVFGNCALCHPPQAAAVFPTGSALLCGPACHKEVTPDVTGPGHMCIPLPDGDPACPPPWIPSFVGPSHTLGAALPLGICGYCHNDKAVNLIPTSSELKCPNCHTVLIPDFYGPGHEARPTREQVPAPHVPPHDLGAQSIFGVCGYCHNDKTVPMTDTVDDLRCPQCHTLQIPNFYGPGHRNLPTAQQAPNPATPPHEIGAQGALGNCGYCHNDKAINLTPTAADLQCSTCHQTVPPPQPPYTFGHKTIPGPELVPAFVGPSHKLPPVQEQAFSYCAYCHNNKATNMADSGVLVSCQYCHYEALTPNFGPGHRNIPGPDKVPSFVGPSHLLGPERVYGICGFCHNATVNQALASTGHGNKSLNCSLTNCHVKLSPDFGLGHESRPACRDCHTLQQTHHDPAVGTMDECVVCHTPHGSPNIKLVQPQILTPVGPPPALIIFNNLFGLADGSFASVSRPGTGVCEVCHTTTRHYNSTGTAEPHFPFSCITCHDHAKSFSPF